MKTNEKGTILSIAYANLVQEVFNQPTAERVYISETPTLDQLESVKEELKQYVNSTPTISNKIVRKKVYGY